METKLTLKLDKSVIVLAKNYAERHHRSLSRLVEDYFKILGSDEDRNHDLSPLVKELSGVVSVKDIDNLDYTSYLEKKYE